MNTTSRTEIYDLVFSYLLDPANDPIDEGSLRVLVSGGSDWDVRYWNTHWGTYKDHMVTLEYVATNNIADIIVWARSVPARHISIQEQAIFERIDLEDEKTLLQSAITSAQTTIDAGYSSDEDLLADWQTMLSSASADDVVQLGEDIYASLKLRDKEFQNVRQCSGKITLWQTRIAEIDAILGV